MPIKLNGATSGSVELDVPAAVGSDLQLTLPATAGEVIVKATDGSVDLGNVDITAAGAATFAGSITAAGDVKAGERDPSATDTRGVRIAVDSQNGGVYTQAKGSANASSYMAFQALHGTTEKFKVMYDGSATFGGGVSVIGGSEIIVGAGNAAFKVRDSAGTTIIGGSGATFGGDISWANADAVLESINSNADARIRATTTSANIYIKSGNQTGVIQSGTGWISASSIRIKNVVDNVDPNQCWEFVKNISLKRYYYKDQQQEGVTYLGPIAEEISALDSEMSVMTNQEDSEGKIPSYNQPLMHMKALSALQTALVRIETLETKVAALEASS